MAISNKKAVEAAKVIADFCKEQCGCQIAYSVCMVQTIGIATWTRLIYKMFCVTSKRRRKIMATCKEV